MKDGKSTCGERFLIAQGNLTRRLMRRGKVDAKDTRLLSRSPFLFLFVKDSPIRLVTGGNFLRSNLEANPLLVLPKFELPIEQEIGAEARKATRKAWRGENALGRIPTCDLKEERTSSCMPHCAISKAGPGVNCSKKVTGILQHRCLFHSPPSSKR